MTAFTLKLDTLYAACLPGSGVVCYGHCQDEALNNLTDELRQQKRGAETGDEKVTDGHALV
jgi:hypothetical protein